MGGADCVSALYSVSYAVKMTLKRLSAPPMDYMDYTVYPLEGIWDLNEKAKQDYDGSFHKDDLVYTLMIRQPDFVTEGFFREMLILTRKKKPNALLDKLQFETTSEGPCVQMLHLGPYDTEPQSFAKMEEFSKANNWDRCSKAHREIYLSDFRKVAPEKLKTVLRFKIKDVWSRD
ncbi:MAG: GyrI-like domain-containing protein [Bacteroidota bacterium]